MAIRTTDILTLTVRSQTCKAIITRTNVTVEQLTIPCKLMTIMPRWTLSMTSRRSVTTATKHGHFTMTFILNQAIMMAMTGESMAAEETTISRRGMMVSRTIRATILDSRTATKDPPDPWKRFADVECHVHRSVDSRRVVAVRCRHRCSTVSHRSRDSHHRRSSVGVEGHQACRHR